MAAGLRPPAALTLTNTRERILLMGGPNMGKTYDIMTIARLSAASGSDAHFHYLDTDEAAGRVLVDPAFKDLWLEGMSGLKNLTLYQVSHWEDLLETLTEVQGQLRQGKFVTKGAMKPGDWLVIDMLTPTWQWVQDWFTNRVYHSDLDEFFLAHRESAVASKDPKAKGTAYDAWRDWPIINQQYAELEDRILRSPGNIICTAEVKAINNDSADKEVRMMFGPYGVIPAGQKRVPHLFSTIIWKTSNIPGVRQAITIKDRAREIMEGVEVDDFAKDYLVGVAGWQTVDPKEALAAAKARAAKKVEKAGTDQ